MDYYHKMNKHKYNQKVPQTILLFLFLTRCTFWLGNIYQLEKKTFVWINSINAGLASVCAEIATPPPVLPCEQKRRADFLPCCSSSKRDTPRLNLTRLQTTLAPARDLLSDAPLMPHVLLRVNHARRSTRPFLCLRFFALPSALH
jgi:hypothetical protein